MKEKISTTLIIRRIIQVIAFILIPGLFASSLNAIQSIIMMLVNMQLNASQLLGDLLLLAVTIIPTIIFGRYFCGYFCSFGLMQDVFSTIGKYTIKFKKRIPKSIDHILKYMKYVVLGGLIVLWVFHIDYGKGPWEVFANYLSLSSWKDLSSFMTWGGFVLILVIIGSLFYERVFCRYLCPMGAIYALLSPMYFFEKYKPTEKCRSCKLCSMTCPMQIDPCKDVITSGECIACQRCINVCPRDNISLKPDKHIVTAASTAAIASLYYAGTILPATLPTSSTITSQAASANLKDGTYTGSGQGLRGMTTVKVVVSNKKISSITVTSYQDDEQYFSRAKTSIINAVLSSQSTDVDTVSGATYSSQGLIEAIKNALNETSSSNATTPDDQTQSSDDNQTQDNDTSSNDASLDFSNLKDGTYTGNGQGFRGTISSSVVVKNGKVTSIPITSYQDDDQFFNRAKSSVINSIISNQSLNVDAVSGATFSSNGIKESVSNALGMTYTNTNSSTEGNHHKGYHHDYH